MNWLAFYLLAFLHVVAFICIGYMFEKWSTRLVLWAILPLPGLWYCSDYFAIKQRHDSMCAEFSGLRIQTQPERTGRVRLIGPGFAHDGRSLLEVYFPRLILVQTMTPKRGVDGRRVGEYLTFSGSLNDSVETRGDGSRKKPRVTVIETPMEFADPMIYEIREQTIAIPDGAQTTIRLTHDGKTLATHTSFTHWWTGIRYPDAVPTWRCPDTNVRVPPPGEPSAPSSRWVYPERGFQQLLNLILK